ncbi:MAG: hypothetical protein K6G33_00930 [Ruminococcus sp.]|uniref:hypothetical protein n=1 Tax=Ruminococcus sp. TaxID=41978 RepID=UPI0025EDCF08|nr:hypothetical protein [Ruminococcus sp.]MCR5599298.1 hypothetical protein [Ruminococcus sp.]
MKKKLSDEIAPNEYICPSASWGDVTGLIPVSAEKADEREAGDEMYPFLPEYGGKRS